MENKQENRAKSCGPIKSKNSFTEKTFYKSGRFNTIGFNEIASRF
jgi:hypothetical protein